MARLGGRAHVLARYTAAVKACGPGAAPEVTSPSERRVPGIKTRRTRGELQRTVWRGIPVTSPARTLVDLAAVVDAETLARAVHETGLTLSKLEAAFLALLRFADLPGPETNRVAGTKRVDCRWPDQHLTVELDSYRYHRFRHACSRNYANCSANPASAAAVPPGRFGSPWGA